MVLIRQAETKTMNKQVKQQSPTGSYVRNRLGTGAEVRPAIVSGIVTGDVPVSYWPIFFCLSPVTVPEVFAEVNSVQSPSRFHTGEWKPRDMSTFPFCSTVFSLGARRQIAKK